MDSEELKVHYDPKEDVLWLAKPGIEEEFRELGSWINIELDAEGEPLGVEIFHASKLLKRVAESIAENAKKAADVTQVVFGEMSTAELNVTLKVDPKGERLGGIWSRGRMGVAHVQGLVFGESETREYTFRVDTPTNFMGLPIEEIHRLGLRKSLGQVKVMGANGPVELGTYFVNAELLGKAFGAIAIPAADPFIGYWLLENRRFRVNRATHQVERVPDDEFHPPFLL